MPAVTISVLNFKGGVGKTTLSVNIAAALANTYSFSKERNFRVLLIDADAQSNASVFMLGEFWRKEVFPNPEKSLYGIMERLKNGNIKTIDKHDIFGQFDESDPKSPVFSIEKKIDQEGASQYVDSDTYWSNLHIIPSHYNLNNFEKDLKYDENGKINIPAFAAPIYYFEMLDRISSFIREYYDFIIIDCPPSLYTMTEISLYFSKNIIIPVIPDWLSTNGINWLIMQVKMLSGKFGGDSKNIRAIIPTLWNIREHVFSRHIRILTKSLGFWKKNENYKDILKKCEIYGGLQRLASINKAIESLRPIIDYQSSEPARVQLELMAEKIANWGDE
ncbi:MAG: AAA family ATPase [Leptospiraceae bacterium]|nr:AAA family ATPase [Leptospiraceae bacterium]